MVTKAKKQLSACRDDVESKLSPVATYKGGCYGLKTHYRAGAYNSTDLYYYKDKQSVKIDLVGTPLISVPRTHDSNDPQSVVGESLYYPTKIGSETKLYCLDFATNRSVGSVVYPQILLIGL